MDKCTFCNKYEPLEQCEICNVQRTFCTLVKLMTMVDEDVYFEVSYFCEGHIDQGVSKNQNNKPLISCYNYEYFTVLSQKMTCTDCNREIWLNPCIGDALGFCVFCDMERRTRELDTI